MSKVRNRPLTSTQYQKLNWNTPETTDNTIKDVFYFPGLVRIRTETDGSCFFHAVVNSYFKPYMTSRINGRAMNRKSFIRSLRRDLAKKLSQQVDPLNDSLTWYETISRGKLPQISQAIPKYSLEGLQKELDSNLPVDNIFNEFISDQLNKDIYILDMVKQDIYITGNDDDILYKNRDSIVILYLPGHYELVGLENNGKLTTLFKHNHPLINAINERKDYLLN